MASSTQSCTLEHLEELPKHPPTTPLAPTLVCSSTQATKQPLRTCISKHPGRPTRSHRRVRFEGVNAGSVLNPPIRNLQNLGAYLSISAAIIDYPVDCKPVEKHVGGIERLPLASRDLNTAPPRPPASKYRFTHCNDCEGGNPNYNGCNHYDDPSKFSPPPLDSEPIPLVRPDLLLYELNHYYSPALLINICDMIRAKALAELFTENIDETARSIFLCTIGGHLGGKDDAAPNSPTKRLARLGSLTWRANTAILRGENLTSTSRIQLLETLKKVENEGGRSLKSIVFEFDGHAVAMEYIREGLLAGVCGFELGKEGSVGGKEVEEEEEDDNDDDDEEMRGDEDERDDEKSDDDEEEKMSKLEEKTAALAEYLKEELKDFRMPRAIE